MKVEVHNDKRGERKDIRRKAGVKCERKRCKPIDRGKVRERKR